MSGLAGKSRLPMGPLERLRVTFERGGLRKAGGNGTHNADGHRYEVVRADEYKHHRRGRGPEFPDKALSRLKGGFCKHQRYVGTCEGQRRNPSGQRGAAETDPQGRDLPTRDGGGEKGQTHRTAKAKKQECHSCRRADFGLLIAISRRYEAEHALCGPAPERRFGHIIHDQRISRRTQPAVKARP